MLKKLLLSMELKEAEKSLKDIGVWVGSRTNFASVGITKMAIDRYNDAVRKLYIYSKGVGK